MVLKNDVIGTEALVTGTDSARLILLGVNQ